MNKWPSFDQLIQMAKTHPEALEQFRQREVEALIEQAPKEMQRRLRGLQFQVDSQRKLHSSALGSCIGISKMMHTSVARLQTALSGYVQESKGADDRAESNSSTINTKGQVIPFPAAG